MSHLIDRNTVFATLVPVFGELVHEKRILSLALGTVGALYTRRVSVAEIGRALAGATMIRTVLADGTPDGLRTFEVSNAAELALLALQR